MSGPVQNKEGMDNKEQKMSGQGRETTIQFGDMESVQVSPVQCASSQSSKVQSSPVSISAVESTPTPWIPTLSLDPEHFNWADEVSDEEQIQEPIEEPIEELVPEKENVQDDAGTSTLGNSEVQDTTEPCVHEEEVGCDIVPENLVTCEEEVQIDMPEEDIVEDDVNKPEDPIVQDIPDTLKAEPESIVKDTSSGDEIDRMDDGISVESTMTKGQMEIDEVCWSHADPASPKPVEDLIFGTEQSTQVAVNFAPAMSYAAVAAAAPTFSPEPFSMSPKVKSDIEKTPSKVFSNTPTKAQVMPIKTPQSSTHITPAVPKSFEKEKTHKPVLPSVTAVTHPTQPEWESVPAKVLEKPQEWVLQTPKKARKTPLHTPVRTAPPAFRCDDQDQEDKMEEETIIPASPTPEKPYTPSPAAILPTEGSPASPSTPSKSKPKRRRPLSKAAKAAKANQAQSSAAGLVAAVENKVLEPIRGIDTIRQARVDIMKAPVTDIEGKEEVEVEVIGRSSIMLLVVIVSVAWILYLISFYAKDVLAYTKESFRADVADL